jgi:hypothetical protein
MIVKKAVDKKTLNKVMENVTTYFFSKILFLGAVLDVVDG